MKELFHYLTILCQNNELLINLILRQFRARYRQSILGIAWAICKPIATVSIFTLVFSYIAKFPSDDLPYPLFSFGALLPWTLFSSALSAGVPSLTNQANLVGKIYFPREILPIADTIGSSLDFIISLIIFIFLLIFYKIVITWNAIFVLLIIIIEILFIFGIVFLLSMLNVWFRDASHAISLLLQFWMYLTPIIYPISMVPDNLKNIYIMNPMVGIVENFRIVLLKGMIPNYKMLMVSAFVSIISFICGYWLFKKNEFKFADII